MQASKPVFLFLSFINVLAFVTSKSTIEPCSNNDSCNALLGYTLYTDLKVSEVASLFQIDPIALLTANSIDISYPDVENHILPSQLFLKIPIICSCVDGIRKSVSTHYKTRPSDTLASIADSIYSGLVSADQIKEANSIQDPSVLDVGQSLVVPLPCTCFNGTDNLLPAIYLSYVVKDVDTLAGIASRYSTTITDLMNVNAMGNPSIKADDILAVPLPACASKFPRYASDYGLIVPNGSYAISASHCVQCSCGPGNLDLYCMPASLAVSCSSMQCRNSNLMVGNVTWQRSSAGCNVTSCNYGGYVNGSIVTILSTSLQPRCPGPQQFPPLLAPPTTVIRDSTSGPAPAPSPQSDGSVTTTPKTTTLVPSTGLAPMGGPIGGASDACALVNSLASSLIALVLYFFASFMISL
ncbi:lysM domain-containing GPI-anchored protein 1 [Ricinus communis]|uniref:LysM domain GPI-anchored protein 1, putative n=1 Tax=Ricinus communis TaxID=3988 RepID=B9RJ77_RICCO|nr:lysM domain-containing GPI-anchored protein 1 [Ricinus communis]EEF48379.1 LysM domain GPI-anchored protein 1 precursor, putative [Ricinus communis]|eukprot:XP_002513796.1 lysM domain-containing GPI-anchored protein 1 [Ricinus communis]